MSSRKEVSGISPEDKDIEFHSDDREQDLSAAEDPEADMNEEGVDTEKGMDPDAGGVQQDRVHAAGDLPGGEDEVQAPRAAKAPRAPSAREVESHELTHCPPRTWCDHCVKGQSKDLPHTTIRGELAESSVVRVSMDYCFLSEEVVAKSTDHSESETAKTVLTVLVLVETLCRSIWAYACESKGAGEQWLIDQIVDDIQTIGLSEERIIVKSDQENSITELQRGIATARAGHGTAIENSRVGDSNSNGRVERAIQDFKGLVRTLRSDLESKIGERVTLESPVVPWMVRHAAHIINVTRVREDGRTAYQLMKGRRCAAKLVPFAETVLFKIPKTGTRVGAFEDRWETGCWLGFIMRSGEHLVGTATGVFKVSAVMRRTADKRWSADIVNRVKGTPEEPVPGSSNRRITAFAKKHQAESTEKTVYMPAPEMVDPETRAAHIHHSDMMEHGASDKCPGCRALKSGKYRAKHTLECRQRFEAILSQSEKGKKRFEAAAERRQDAITKKAVELQGKIEADQAMADTKAAADGSQAAASGSDVEGQKGQDKDDTVAKDVDGDMNDAADDAGKPGASSSSAAATPTTVAVAAYTPQKKGIKRGAETPDDSSRAIRDMEAQTAETRGQKRAGESPDESARLDRSAADMSSMDESNPGHHGSVPGPRHRGDEFPKGDLEWKDIGSGVMAKTFPQMARLVTTSRGGPQVSDVYKRVVRSLTTGKIIDECILDDTPDSVLNRMLPCPDHVRVELTMRGAIKMFEVKGADVSEVFSPPRVAQEASVRQYGGRSLKPGWSLDLTREDPLTGEAWDLGKHEVRERVRKLVRDTKPFMLIGSPPCTLFCALQNLQKGKRDEKAFQRRLENAKRHVMFCIELYTMQLRGGRFFLHEHPESASSWRLPEIMQMVLMDGVLTTVCDMCAYGMVAEDELGEAPAKKCTRLMSNSPEVIKRVSKRCTNKLVESGERSLAPTDEAVRPKLPGGVSGCRCHEHVKHRHADLMGGRARQCQVYPRDFCRAVCEGVASQKKLMELGLKAEPLMALDEMYATVPDDLKSGDPGRDLHEYEDEYVTWDGMTAFDDQTGVQLKPALMQAARREEIVYFKNMKVYTKVDISEAWQETGHAPIAVRWVDINKGDETSPNYRSRLVAKEFKTDVRPELYAATPPSECLRLMMSRMASTPGAQMMYADVSRAYFYAKAVRPVYVKLPEEDIEPGDENKCGRLIMSMYGTRDAALNWSSEYTETLVAGGFEQGRANPCLFWHPETDVAIMVHGDDFVAVGDEKHLAKTRETLESKYKLKVEVLGSGPGCRDEIRVLNKILRHTDEGLELEADPRHAEIVVRELGLLNAKASRVPGAKEPKKREIVKNGGREILVLDEEQYLSGGLPIDFHEDGFELDAMDDKEDVANEAADDEEDLEGAESTQYRAIAARLNYLAPDRMDVQYAVKESARAMSAPKRKHWRMLHRIGRYLLGAPRMVMRFPWQVEQSMMSTFTDSDWAGCPTTARSTSGGIIAIGDHVIKSYSRQQKVVALSSAEAELYAMVVASQESLAISSYCRDLGRKLSGEVFTDSAAALGISQRAGIGKVRHLRTQGLWVQEVRVSGRLQYRKVLGTKNPSDVLTKHVPADLLEKHIETMGMTLPGGRAQIAPELNSLESVVMSWTGTLAGCGETAGDRCVRFSSTVQFRAVPMENRGRRCRQATKLCIPGGVTRKPSAASGQIETERTVRGLSTRAGGPSVRGGELQEVSRSSSDVLQSRPSGRPSWADLSEDVDSLYASDFHGSAKQPNGTATLPWYRRAQGLEN